VILQPGPAVLAAFEIGIACNALRWHLWHDAAGANGTRADLTSTFASLKSLPGGVSARLDFARLRNTLHRLDEVERSWVGVRDSESFAEAWCAAFRDLGGEYNGPYSTANPPGPSHSEIGRFFQEFEDDADRHFAVIEKAFAELFEEKDFSLLFQLGDWLDRGLRPRLDLTQLIRLAPWDAPRSDTSARQMEPHRRGRAVNGAPLSRPFPPYQARDLRMPDCRLAPPSR
jgi:hypothetical protein